MDKEILDFKLSTSDIEKTTEEDVKRSFHFRKHKGNILVDIHIFKGNTIVQKEKQEINKVRMVRLYPQLKYRLDKIINLDDVYVNEIIKNSDIELEILEVILSEKLERRHVIKMFSEFVEKHDDPKIPIGSYIGTITIDYDTFIYMINSLSKLFYSRYI